MNNQVDIAKMLKDAMGAFSVKGFNHDAAFNSAAELNEKASTVALSALAKTTDISNAWAQETFALASDVSKAKSDPADVIKSMTDFATGYSKLAHDQLTAFAGVAKGAQTEMLELLTTAGTRFGATMTETVTAPARKAKAAAK